MLKGGSTGGLKHHRVSSGSSVSFVPKGDFYFIYLVSGKATFGQHSAKAGDLISIKKEYFVELQAQDKCDVIEIEVHFAGSPHRKIRT